MIDPGAYSSESELDDLPGSKIELPDDFQNRKKNTNVALRLHELGPRMTLKLIKIEEGVCRGNVVHHSFITKTPGEIKQQFDSLKDKRELKAQRKKQQEENVRKKQIARGELKEDEADQNEDAANDDVKDEHEDARVLGKRKRNELGLNRTGRTDKKALVKD